MGLAVLAYAWLGATPDICRVPGTTQSVVYDDDRSGYQVVVLEGDEFKSYIVPGTCYTSQSDYTPSIAVEGYRGYNILQLELSFYGILQGEGAFDHSKYQAGGYLRAVDGDTLKEVKDQIRDLVSAGR